MYFGSEKRFQFFDDFGYIGARNQVRIFFPDALQYFLARDIFLDLLQCVS